MSFGTNISFPQYFDLSNFTKPLFVNILTFPFAFIKVVGALRVEPDVRGLVLKSPDFKYMTDLIKFALSASISLLLKSEIE